MLRRLVVACGFGALVGVACGVAGAGFLAGLAWVTERRAHTPWLPWLLPLAGAVMGRVLSRVGAGAVGGTGRVVAGLRAAATNVTEDASGSAVAPWELGATAWLGTWTTHLFGGSAGREGTALQLGGSLAEGLRAAVVRWAPAVRVTQGVALSAGVAGGFGAVFGTPLAGAVFALELVGARAWSRAPERLFPALLAAASAALVGDALARAVDTGHSVFPRVTPWALTPRLVLAWVVFAAVVALVVRAFVLGTDAVRRAVAPLAPGWRLLVGGLAVVALWRLVGTDAYLGLGVPGIVGAHAAPADLDDVGWKLAFTALTVGSGFSGGEVTPLFFVGATLGSACAGALGVPVALGAGVGMASVFGAAARTPLALSVMAAELVGAEVLPHAVLVGGVASLLAGKHMIYVPFQHVEAPRS